MRKISYFHLSTARDVHDALKGFHLVVLGRSCLYFVDQIHRRRPVVDSQVCNYSTVGETNTISGV